ncbi:hypothetical protein ACSQ67_005793 [Phaseolus vulgaris]
MIPFSPQQQHGYSGDGGIGPIGLPRCGPFLVHRLGLHRLHRFHSLRRSLLQQRQRPLLLNPPFNAKYSIAPESKLPKISSSPRW